MGLINWIEHAVDEGLLQVGSPDYNLAQQAISKGLDTLSPQERAAYLTQVVPILNEAARRQFARPSSVRGLERRR